jgi:hypothetical protein
MCQKEQQFLSQVFFVKMEAQLRYSHVWVCARLRMKVSPLHYESFGRI